MTLLFRAASVAIVLLAGCTQSRITVLHVYDDCKSGSPPAPNQIIRMLTGIPRTSFDMVDESHTTMLLGRYGGVRVALGNSEIEIPGVAGKLSRDDYLPVRGVTFIQFPGAPPLAYVQTTDPRIGPYRATFTSGSVDTLCR